MSRALRKLDKELDLAALSFSAFEEIGLPRANAEHGLEKTANEIFSAVQRAKTSGDGAVARSKVAEARRQPQLSDEAALAFNQFLDIVIEELDAADEADAAVLRDRASGPRSDVAPSKLGRLIDCQTAIDFVGRRKYGFAVSAVLIILSVLSLTTQGLNLGIDFEGGVSWDVPADNGFTVDDAEDVLADNGLSTEGARLQLRSSESGEFVKVQVGSQPEEVGAELRSAFADAAEVTPDEVNVTLVSSSWGSEITDKAIRALLIFIVIVSIFISIRFEWRMALAAIIAMLHDVLISVGVYSIFQFVVTPPTVIAFLTILGYSLYDTIVVFDRVKENEARFAAHKPPYDDVINVSMNQVLMRTLTTTFSSVVPVISLLLIGAGVLGQATLSEFALALLIGMLTGTYSSIIVAAPILGLLKKSDKSWGARNIPRAVGEPLREMVMGAGVGSRRAREEAADAVSGEPAGSTVDRRSSAGEPTRTEAKAALSHPPRPRKKKRR